MRGVVYAGLALVGVAALSAVTQQAFHDLPWAGVGPRPRRLRREVRRPAAVRPVHAAADPRRRHRAGPRRARRQARPQPARARTSRRRSCSRSSALGMVLVGMLGGALAADHRPRPAGHGVRGGVARLRRLRRRARRPRRRRLVAAEVGRAHACPAGPAMGLALLGVLATILAVAAVLHRRLRRPAGGVGHVRLRRPVGAVEHRRHGRPRPDVRSSSLGFVGARRCGPSRDGDGRWPTTRRAARRSSG